jgi:hypothetical protein
MLASRSETIPRDVDKCHCKITYSTRTTKKLANST